MTYLSKRKWEKVKALVAWRIKGDFDKEVKVDAESREEALLVFYKDRHAFILDGELMRLITYTGNGERRHEIYLEEPSALEAGAFSYLIAGIVRMAIEVDKEAGK